MPAPAAAPQARALARSSLINLGSRLLAVALATVAWGVDNTLSRGVAERDPGQVVLVKAALGALRTNDQLVFKGS